MGFREVQVKNVGGQYVAFHPDSPEEQIAGSSPWDAIRRLNDYRREQEDALKQYRRLHASTLNRKRKMAMAAVFVVVFGITVVVAHQLTTKPAQRVIYAHHTSQSNDER